MMKKVFKGCLMFLSLVGILFGMVYAGIRVSSWLPIEQTTADLTPPGPFTQTMRKLVPTNIRNAKGISAFQSSSKPDEIVTLYQAVDDMDLLTVHESGLFHRWDMEAQALEAEYDFSAGHRTGVSFSADGTQIVTPGKLVSDGLLYGYSLWDTNTGEMLACWGDHCPDPIPFNELLLDTGIVLSPNGNWVVEYYGYTARADTLRENVASSGYLHVDSGYRDNKYYSIDRIAFDRSGIYLAVAVEQGILQVYDSELEFLSIADKRTLIEEGKIPGEVFPDGGISFTSQDRQYGKYDNENPIQTSDLAIDDTRTWLARLFMHLFYSIPTRLRNISK